MGRNAITVRVSCRTHTAVTCMHVGVPRTPRRGLAVALNSRNFLPSAVFRHFTRYACPIASYASACNREKKNKQSSTYRCRQRSHVLALSLLRGSQSDAGPPREDVHQRPFKGLKDFAYLLNI